MSNKKKKSERRDKKEDKKTSKEVPTAYLAPDDFEVYLLNSLWNWFFILSI